MGYPSEEQEGCMSPPQQNEQQEMVGDMMNMQKRGGKTKRVRA